MDFNINPNECVSNIVNTIKSNGSFDQFRRECLSDVDTKVTDSDWQQFIHQLYPIIAIVPKSYSTSGYMCQQVFF